MKTKTLVAVSPRFRFALTAFGLFLLLAVLPSARAQSVQIVNTNVAARSITTQTGNLVASEWAALANHPKTRSLLTWATSELRCTPVPVPQEGLTTIEQLRFARTGAPVTADQDVRQTIVPVRCASSRYPKATVALLFNRYVSAGGLAYPRLLIRYGNNGYMVEEYSMRRDNRVTKMTCKFGDCVFRTSLLVMEKLNPNAYRSLMAVFGGSAQEPVFNTLRRLYDVRGTSIGQKELALFSGIMISSNLEEEFEAGYISNTLDQSFKPDRRDSWIVTEAKKLAKDIIDDLRKRLASAIGKFIASLFG